jgi:hypothetical protein
MLLRIDPTGRVEGLCGEAIDLAALGALSIRRVSHVEPDGHGAWFADLSPRGGPRLGPYAKRSAALAAEEAWIHRHLFGPP